MARLDWAVLCDHAFFDREHRLCVVGVFGKVSARTLPLAPAHMMLVAHLTDIQPVEELEVSLAVVTPNARFVTPRNPKCVVVDIVQEYVIVTLRDLPLTEEGVYRFQVALKDQLPVSVDVPLLMVTEPALSEIH